MIYVQFIRNGNDGLAGVTEPRRLAILKHFEPKIAFKSGDLNLKLRSIESK